MGIKKFSILILLFVLAYTTSGQQAVLKGKVLDEHGSPLKEVSVYSSNNRIGTITDGQGYFYLTLSKGQVDMEFSIQGFNEELCKFQLNRDTTLTVNLVASAILKGKQRKQNLESVNSSSSPDKKESEIFTEELNGN